MRCYKIQFQKKALINNWNLNSIDVYMIIFTLLSVKSNTLVYIYIHYNYLFTRILDLFLVSRNEMIACSYKKSGNFLSFINKNLLPEITTIKNTSDKLSLSLSSTDYINNMFSNINSNIFKKDYISKNLDIIKKLMYISTYNKMSNLTKMAVNKDYKEFICNIWKSQDDWHFYKNFFFVELKLSNIIDSCIFIIKDKNKFINLISNTLHDKNEGKII